MRAPLALALAAAAVLAGCTGATREVGPLVGNEAPGFTVQAVDGSPFALAEQRGKAVLLDLMGVNCAPCRAQMPHLVALAASADPAEMALVSVDMASVYPGLGARSAEEIRAFAAEFNATWPFAPDTAGVGTAYQPIAIPTLVFIGPDGVIRAKHSGGVMTAEDLEATLAKARAASAEEP